MVVLALITLVGPLAIHFFLPVMPAVAAVFAVSDAVAQATFSITLATMAVTTLIYGALSDRYGRRPVLLAGLALFVAGSVLAALAPSIGLLLLARLLQAAGAGSGIALARAMARDAYGPDRLVHAIAYLTMAYTLGPMVAPPLAGLLGHEVDWRTVFWAAAGIGLLILFAAWRVLHETLPVRPDAGAPLARIGGDFVTLFRHRRFTAFVAQSGFSTGTFFALAAGSSFLMQDYLGRPASEYGLYFLAFPLGYCLGNYVSSRLGGRVAIERMVVIGSTGLVGAVAVLGMLLLAGAMSPLAIFLPGFVLTFAQGLALPNAQAGLLRAVPHLAGTAAGIGVFTQMLGGAVFSQVFGLVSDGTPVPLVLVVSLAAVLTLAAALVAARTRST